MIKKSQLDKAIHGITILHQISLGITPNNSWSQITLLSQKGYVLIHDGRKLELTLEGKKRAKLFSKDSKVFKANIKELYKPKTPEESSETMPLFYEDCKICIEEKKKFQDYVNADIKYLEDGGIPPIRPELKKHEHNQL